MPSSSLSNSAASNDVHSGDEAGNGSNTGRITMFDRGRRRTSVIDQLPSAINNGRPGGPSGLLQIGTRWYILIGAGDSVLPGPVAGTEVPNPSPSSPLWSSLLAAEFDSEDEGMSVGFGLPREAHERIAAGEVVTLVNGRGQRCRLWRVADFPNYLPEPRPGAEAAVRVSNPYGLLGTQGRIDVIDASRNLMWRVQPDSGEIVPFAFFPMIPSAVVPGPPVVDPVPTSIRAVGNDFLVSLLTGFPFGPSTAQVRLVDRVTGASTAVVTGLQTAIDVLPVTRGRGRFYVLEYSNNFQAGGPGRLLRIDEAGASPTVLAAGLRSPTSMAIDPVTGDMLVTDDDGGRLMLVAIPR